MAAGRETTKQFSGLSPQKSQKSASEFDVFGKLPTETIEKAEEARSYMASNMPRTYSKQAYGLLLNAIKKNTGKNIEPKNVAYLLSKVFKQEEQQPRGSVMLPSEQPRIVDLSLTDKTLLDKVKNSITNPETELDFDFEGTPSENDRLIAAAIIQKLFDNLHGIQNESRKRVNEKSFKNALATAATVGSLMMPGGVKDNPTPGNASRPAIASVQGTTRGQQQGLKTYIDTAESLVQQGDIFKALEQIKKADALSLGVSTLGASDVYNKKRRGGSNYSDPKAISRVYAIKFNILNKAIPLVQKMLKNQQTDRAVYIASEVANSISFPQVPENVNFESYRQKFIQLSQLANTKGIGQAGN